LWQSQDRGGLVVPMSVVHLVFAVERVFEVSACRWLGGWV
jgi:hypothetical protein